MVKRFTGGRKPDQGQRACCSETLWLNFLPIPLLGGLIRSQRFWGPRMKFRSWPPVLLLVALAGCGLARAEKGATCRAIEAGQPVAQPPYSTLSISRRAIRFTQPV